jgi:hypothetical protein
VIQGRAMSDGVARPARSPLRVRRIRTLRSFP